MRWDEWGTRRKISQSKEENQQQTTYEHLGKLMLGHTCPDQYRSKDWHSWLECNLLCQRSRVLFLGFTSNLVWTSFVPTVGARGASCLAARKWSSISNSALCSLRFRCWWARNLWHSGFSLVYLESVSFVEKVGTKAKKMGGGKGRKGILFSSSPSSIILLSLLLSRNNSNGNICYAVISTRYRLRRTLRVGGKKVFFLCCLQSLLMKMNPLSIKVLCKKS